MRDPINNRQVNNAATRLFPVPDENSTSPDQLSQLIHMEKEVAFDTYATEIIQASDSRAQSELINEATSAEVFYLAERGTFKVMRTSELPDDANFLTDRFVMTIKADAQGREMYKARYVVGGHRDNMKNYLVHGTQTLQKP